MAGRVSVGLPPNVEQADFVSSGVFGLIDAIEKFEPERSIKFETYAITRIRGAMIDELRALDWIPRSVRQKARAVERAYATLEAQLRRTPSRTTIWSICTAATFGGGTRSTVSATDEVQAPAALATARAVITWR